MAPVGGRGACASTPALPRGPGDPGSLAGWPLRVSGGCASLPQARRSAQSAEILALLPARAKVLLSWGLHVRFARECLPLSAVNDHVRGASVPSKSFEVSRGNSAGGAAVRAAECVGSKWAPRWGPATTQWRAGAFVPRHRRARRTRLRHQEPYRRDPHGPTSSRRSRNQLIQLTLPGAEKYILLVWRHSLQPSLPTDSRVRPRHSRLPHTRQHLPLPPRRIEERTPSQLVRWQIAPMACSSATETAPVPHLPKVPRVRPPPSC